MMTKSERVELGQLIRKRERVVKAQATERAAQMLADFEAQIASIYAFDDDQVWKEATEEAQKVVDQANVKIRQRCKALGIPAEFAPSLSFGWQGRGQNAVAWRRAELRRVAKAKIEALMRETYAKIERMSLTAQTEIVTHGLESNTARQFLDALPKLETLMPSLNAKEIKSLTDKQHVRKDWI